MKARSEYLRVAAPRIRESTNARLPVSFSLYRVRIERQRVTKKKETLEVFFSSEIDRNNFIAYISRAIPDAKIVQDDLFTVSSSSVQEAIERAEIEFEMDD